MRDPLDTKIAEKIQEKQEKKEKREINDWKKLLLMPEFRRVVMWLLGISGYFNDPMTGNSYTFYNNGKQEVGRDVMRKVFTANPNIFAQMQQEIISEAKAEKEE